MEAKWSKFVPNYNGIAQLGLRGSGVNSLVVSVTNSKAKSAANMAEWQVGTGAETNDDNGLMRVEIGITKHRRRGAILAQHPNPKSRLAGRDALMWSI